MFELNKNHTNSEKIRLSLNNIKFMIYSSDARIFFSGIKFDPELRPGSLKRQRANILERNLLPS